MKKGCCSGLSQWRSAMTCSGGTELSSSGCAWRAICASCCFRSVPVASFSCPCAGLLWPTSSHLEQLGLKVSAVDGKHPCWLSSPKSALQHVVVVVKSGGSVRGSLALMRFHSGGSVICCLASSIASICRTGCCSSLLSRASWVLLCVFWM